MTKRGLNFKSLSCLLFGHKVSTQSCPVTGASKTICLRCSITSNHSVMSFK